MKINWIVLIIFILACNLVGSLGSLWTSSDTNWYKELKKPSFNPPSWVFAPVWTLLFTLVGIALYLIFYSPSSKLRMISLILFGIQFLLNILWSYLFFGLQNPLYSLIEIFALILSITATGIYFYLVIPLAGYLIIPYFLWVSFATVLNFFIWKLNV